MTPMEPLPETIEVLEELQRTGDAEGLLHELCRLAERAQSVVPDLVGVSLARLRQGISFTLVATEAEIAVLDGVQYLTGGPCVDGAHRDELREFEVGDVLDEQQWQLFAEATAARSIRSTLTLPVIEDGAVAGTVNLYAATRRAFGGHHEELAGIFGAWAAGAVANADLSFLTRREAQAATQRLRDRATLDVAIGILAARLGVDTASAEEHLHQAALRAGVTAEEIAGSIVDSRSGRNRSDT